jgi:NTE family protein
MEIAVGARISSGIPLFFRPYLLHNDYYVDGGIVSNLPMEFIATDMYKLLNNYDEKIIGEKYTKVDLKTAVKNLYDNTYDDTNDKTFQKYILNKTIGIKTYSPKTLRYIDPSNSYGIIDTPSKNMSLLEFSTELLSIMMDTCMKLHIDNNYWNRIVKINTEDRSIVEFNMTDQDKQTLINIGSATVKQFISGISQ